LKSQGIVFFTDWVVPCPLLIVALHSLKKHYIGNVHVVYGNNTPAFFIDALKSNSFITTSNYNPDYQKSYWTRLGSRRCWNLKPTIHSQSPFDLTLIYDCDHVFVDTFDQKAFEMIDQYGLVSFHHPKEHYNHKYWKRANTRARTIRDVIKLPCEDNTLLSANGGCVGSSKEKSPALLAEWQVLMEKFGTCGNMFLVRLPDEFSLSYTILKNKIPMGGHYWSYSPYPDLSDLNPLPKTSAIHFCNSSYVHGSYFKIEQDLCLDEDYMGLKTNWDQYIKCNPNIEIARKAV